MNRRVGSGNRSIFAAARQVRVAMTRSSIGSTIDPSCMRARVIPSRTE